MEYVSDPNEKIAYLRSCVVGALVEQCARTFIDNEDAILEGRFEGSLLNGIRDLERQGYARCNELSWTKIYRSSEVVDIELAGNRIITFLLERLVEAVTHPELNYSRLLLAKFPEQYDVTAPTPLRQAAGGARPCVGNDRCLRARPLPQAQRHLTPGGVTPRYDINHGCQYTVFSIISLAKFLDFS